jgi:hypothetical protein
MVLFCSGCGMMKYSTTMTLPDGKKVNLESNIPAAVKGDGYEIDQRGLSVWEKLFPQNINVKK